MLYPTRFIGRFLLSGAISVALATAANAACYADYKAKQEDPLELHYGVVELQMTPCDDEDAAAANITERIAGEGWMLLNIVSMFDEAGLDERQESAGEFYLRY